MEKKYKDYLDVLYKSFWESGHGVEERCIMMMTRFPLPSPYTVVEFLIKVILRFRLSLTWG
jgi:hypothetical protein